MFYFASTANSNVHGIASKQGKVGGMPLRVFTFKQLEGPIRDLKQRKYHKIFYFRNSYQMIILLVKLALLEISNSQKMPRNQQQSGGRRPERFEKVVFAKKKARQRNSLASFLLRKMTLIWDANKGDL